MPIHERLELGKQVSKWREQHLEDPHWLRSFIFHHYGDALRRDAMQLKRLDRYCRKAADLALRESQGILGDTGRSVQGHSRKDGARTTRAPFHSRTRMIGAGRRESFADLGTELFQFWVDRAHALKVRVPTAELMTQARTLLALGKATYEQWKAADRPDQPCKLPESHYLRVACSLAPPIRVDLAFGNPGIQGLVEGCNETVRRPVAQLFAPTHPPRKTVRPEPPSVRQR